MSAISIAALGAAFAGLGCGVAGLVLRRRHFRLATVLIATFWLLMGVGMQVYAWNGAVERRRASSESLAKTKAIALETLSIARNTKWPANRDEALGLTEKALGLIEPEASGSAFPSSYLMSLIHIVIGSVMLTLALTRPGILMTRRERDAQIVGRGDLGKGGPA